MAKRNVPKKKKGVCVIKGMAAGLTKTEAREDCGVIKSGAKKPRKAREKCHGRVHIKAHDRACPHKK